MSALAWIASFVYLAALAAWITADVRAPEGAASEDPGPVARRAAAFFGLTVAAMLVFAGIILLIQKI